jgi:hypothetical protein
VTIGEGQHAVRAFNVLLVFGFKFAAFSGSSGCSSQRYFSELQHILMEQPPQQFLKPPLHNLFFKLHASTEFLTQPPLAAYRALVCAFAWRRVLADPTIMNIIAPLFSRVICPALDAQAVPGAVGWVDLSCTA